uniref:Uncharacterized protein n=1 Tax=Amphimedon queenslandica TaxID=400682 RepID=A0A1X7VKB7_AMPQE
IHNGRIEYTRPLGAKWNSDRNQ